MKKFNPVTSIFLAFFSVLLALVVFELIIFISIHIITVLNVTLDSVVLFGLSTIFVLVIAGSFALSALMGCTHLTVSLCYNKWTCLWLGIIVSLFFIFHIVVSSLYSIYSEETIRVIIFDIPMVIYGVFVSIYGFINGDPEMKDRRILDLSELVCELSTACDVQKAVNEKLREENIELQEQVKDFEELQEDYFRNYKEKRRLLCILQEPELLNIVVQRHKETSDEDEINELLLYLINGDEDDDDN